MSDNRIKELEKLILNYQKSYYTGFGEVISDAEFDALWDELQLLDPKNSIFKKVGSDLFEDYDEKAMLFEGNFKKVEHLIPMGSLAKASNPEQFLAWTKKMVFSDFLVEYKLDGASLELQYENGVFVKAVTRGDGHLGDDITANVQKMNGVIKNLSMPLTGGVRGEVIMTHSVHKTHFSEKANCRNAANGLMKRKDGNGSELLDVICYDAWFDDSFFKPFSDEKEKVLWLKSEGFSTVTLTSLKGGEAVVDYRASVMEKRKDLNYDIDGLVIKGYKFDLKDASRARPEKQIAFKFSLEEAVSVLKDVEWSQSGSRYTPVGIFDSVQLNGTTVKRASLVNPSTIRALGVKIGSHVVITKRGEIIPKIERVISDDSLKDEQDIIFPQICETCQTPLVDDGTLLSCPNRACSKRIHHRIEKWVSVLDIRDFGIGLIHRLYEMNRIRSIYDIYTLKESEIAELERLGEKSASKIIASIQGRRIISLEQFIAGFDIEGIGETLVEKLIDAGFGTIESFFDASVESLSDVAGFGDITARNLKEGLEECADEMRRLLDDEIIRIKTIDTNGSFVGKSFCFTGELYTMKRSEAQQKVKARGGSSKSSVVKSLSYLVTNTPESGSAKNKKALDLGVTVITEKEFLELLKA